MWIVIFTFLEVPVTSIVCHFNGNEVITTDPRKPYADARRIFGYPTLSGVSPSQINYPIMELDVEFHNLKYEFNTSINGEKKSCQFSATVQGFCLIFIFGLRKLRCTHLFFRIILFLFLHEYSWPLIAVSFFLPNFVLNSNFGKWLT